MKIIDSDLPVTSIRQVAEETYALRFHCPEFPTGIKPGQFFNIRVNDSIDPLLRRQYSISDVIGEECEILFAIAGKGTAILSKKRPGDVIGVLGPLGNSFGYEKEFSTAIIVAGGIGIAPFPYLNKELVKRGIHVLTFAGARNAGRIVRTGLQNLHIATDDGSEGYHGTVVDCLAEYLSVEKIADPMIFACGPNPMLAATQQLAFNNNLKCELSLESEMACGIGICQGCPIERKGSEGKYALVCTEGPCFDHNEIIIRNNHQK